MLILGAVSLGSETVAVERPSKLQIMIVRAHLWASILGDLTRGEALYHQRVYPAFLKAIVDAPAL